MRWFALLVLTGIAGFVGFMTGQHFKAKEVQATGASRAAELKETPDIPVPDASRPRP